MNNDNLLRAAGELQRADEARSATPRGQSLEAPLDEAFRLRLKSQLTETLSQPETRDSPDSMDSPEPSTEGKVLRGRFGKAGTWFAPLALAAGLAFFLLPQTSLAPLPSYHLELRGNVQQQRSSTPAVTREVPEFLPASTLELLLRPASAIDGPLEVRALALPEVGAAKELRFEVQISDQGAVQLRSQVAELGLEAGTWTIVVAAARSGRLPDLDALDPTPSGDDLIVLRQPVRILDPTTGDG